MWRRCMGALLVLLSAGCGSGEVTGFELPIAPDNAAGFGAAREAMLAIGCGQAGCHSAIVGNFQITDNPAGVQDEYLLTKAFVDLTAPEESVLVRVALSGDPEQVGHPACFADTTGCAWQILSAWMREGTFTEDQDGNALVSPVEIAKGCTPTANACFTGGD